MMVGNARRHHRPTTTIPPQSPPPHNRYAPLPHCHCPTAPLPHCHRPLPPPRPATHSVHPIVILKYSNTCSKMVSVRKGGQ